MGCEKANHFACALRGSLSARPAALCFPNRAAPRLHAGCRHDTTPMSSEVHGNGLGTKAKPSRLTPRRFCCLCPRSTRAAGSGERALCQSRNQIAQNRGIGLQAASDRLTGLLLYLANLRPAAPLPDSGVFFDTVTVAQNE
jgi:hypothetical protein